MCGLVGCAGKIFLTEKKILADLMYLDIRRGKDSTGLAIIKDDNTTKIYKSLGTPFDLVRKYKNEFDWKDLTPNTFQVKAMIGHNRWATVGAVTDDNAHPFEHGEIIGAHNGTLTRHHLHRIDGNELFEVDSEAVFYSINKNGLENTIATMHGAWALTWWDKAAKTMNFIRNKERPLYYLWTKDHDTLFWASEDWMLKLAFAWNKKEALGEPTLFQENIYYYLDLENTKEIRQTPITYEREPIVGFIPPAPVKPQWQNVVGNIFNNHRNTTYDSYQYGGNSKPKNDDKTYSSLVNKEVVFFISGVKTSVNGLDYFECESIETDHTLLFFRLYGANNNRNKEWRNAAKEGGYYKGKIKKHVRNYIKGKKEEYLLFDVRSISDEIDWQDAYGVKKEDIKDDIIPFEPTLVDDGKNTIILDGDGFNMNDTYKGYLGEELTYQEFMHNSKKGCVWCSEHPTTHNHDKITWLNKQEFLCDICDVDGTAQRYYPQYQIGA